MPWLVIVILVVAGVANGVCGYLIWRRRVYGLIAGYDPQRPPRDPDAVGRWVGKGSIAVGTWCVGGAIALALVPTYARPILQVLALGILIGVGLVLIGGMKRATRKT